jgi:hypothetical protein
VGRILISAKKNVETQIYVFLRAEKTQILRLYENADFSPSRNMIAGWFACRCCFCVILCLDFGMVAWAVAGSAKTIPFAASLHLVQAIQTETRTDET